ncbi:hypothetical protein GOV13_00190 [Candidatus Pacearchaeota archaeon]|nr:hypothetical protein [Candidatus Pacearchaeota archaeon]
MGDPQFKSEIMKVKRISQGLAHLTVKKRDDTLIEFDDYLITDDEFSGYCTNANLETLTRQELFFKKERFPIFNFYVLR